MLEPAYRKVRLLSGYFRRSANQRVLRWAQDADERVAVHAALLKLRAALDSKAI